MNIEEARRNMITQQVCASGVNDLGVLNLLAHLPREHFVPLPFRGIAFADTRLFLDGVFMLTPSEEGLILQALQVLPTETVLVLGTGSGYLSALLARQANYLYSVDHCLKRTLDAQARFAHLGFENVTLLTRSDLSEGLVEHAPYDVIVLVGSVSKISLGLAKQVNVGGRIFAVVGDSPSMRAMLYTRETKTRWKEECLYDTDLCRLGA